MNPEVLHRKKHVRNDGWLAEMISSTHGDTPFSGLHTYIVHIVPEGVRARHYHKHKEEWLALGCGSVKVILEEPETRNRFEFTLVESAETYDIIHIPPGMAHAVKNIGSTSASVIVFSREPEMEGETVPYEMEA